MPKEQGVVGNGQTNISPTRCNLLPASHLFSLNISNLAWSPFLWSSRGVDLISTNHSLHQKEDPEALLLPLNPLYSPSGRSSSSAPATNRVTCWTQDTAGSSERDKQPSVQRDVSYLHSQFLTSESCFTLTFSVFTGINEGGNIYRASPLSQEEGISWRLLLQRVSEQTCRETLLLISTFS